MKPTVDNSAIAEILDQQVNNENALLSEIDAAKTFTDLKKVATKYPDIFDIKGYKSFSSLYEAMLGALEPAPESNETTPETFDVEKNAEGVKQHEKKEKKVKAPKVKKVKEASAFGTAIEILCKHPTITYKELVKACSKKGFDKASSMQTASAQFGKIYKLLSANGFIK